MSKDATHFVQTFELTRDRFKTRTNLFSKRIERVDMGRELTDPVHRFAPRPRELFQLGVDGFKPGFESVELSLGGHIGHRETLAWANTPRKNSAIANA